MRRIDLRFTVAFALILITEIIIGVYVHDQFVRPYIGDVLVIALIYTLVRIFTRKSRFLCLWIFLIGLFTEIIQLLNIPGMLGLSDGSIIKIIIGSTFDTADILCYFIGGVICTSVDIFIYRKAYKTKKTDV